MAILYTMHNILRTDGTETMPGKPILAETEDVKKMIAWATGKFKRVIDLGAGEGGYAIAFLRAGFDVTAVEARSENCEKIHAIDKRVAILQMTVEHYLQYHYKPPPKDTLVLCLGLLYHLKTPADVLNAITKKCGGLILSTHYALEYHWQYDRVPPVGSWLLKRIWKRFPFLFTNIHFGLSKLTMHQGRRGRWYPEYPSGYKKVIRLTHSSYHNHKSFWLTTSEIDQICGENQLPLIWKRIKPEGQNFLAYFERKVD